MRQLGAVVLLCLLVGTQAFARTPNDFERNSSTAFARPEKDGFFFYRDSKEKQTSKAEPSAEGFNGEIPWDLVEKMHPDEFGKLMDDVQKWSIQDPQPDRLKDYMTLQSVAVMRSENYSRVWAQVLRENPALDPTVARSPTRIGSRIEAQARNEQTSSIISEMKEQMGILFFTRPGCQYCAEQRNILLGFMDHWDWRNVQEVDVNEFPLAAAEYGVQMVPDLFVVGNTEGGEIRRQRLRAGLTTRQEIEGGLAEAYSRWFLGRSNMLPQQAESEEIFRQFLQKQLTGSSLPGALANGQK